MNAKKVANLIDELINAHSYHNRQYNFDPKKSIKQINEVKRRLADALESQPTFTQEKIYGSKPDIL